MEHVMAMPQQLSRIPFVSISSGGVFLGEFLGLGCQWQDYNHADCSAIRGGIVKLGTAPLIMLHRQGPRVSSLLM
jgi:hypothetical protein